MDWKIGSFCVAKSSFESGGFHYNAKILEVFSSRMKARVVDIRCGNVEEVSIEDLQSFELVTVNKSGALVEQNSIDEEFIWPKGWKVGDDCISQWEAEETTNWYNAVVLKIFNINEVLVYFVDYGNADFTSLDKILDLDFTLICGENNWRVSSVLLAKRSPFFSAAIVNNNFQQPDKKLEIKDLDTQAMQEVINYIHGIPIKAEEALFSSLLEASERFQMNDMKSDVISIGKKLITVDNAVEIGKLAEFYNIEDLLKETTEFIVNNGIKIEEGNMAPKLTMGVLSLMTDSHKSLITSYQQMLQDKNDTTLAKDELEDELNCLREQLQEIIQEKAKLLEERDQLIHQLKTEKEEKERFKEKYYDCQVDNWEAMEERAALLEEAAGQEMDQDESEVSAPEECIKDNDVNIDDDHRRL